MPKCLVPIAGKPILAYWIETLISIGITDILINTHYLADQLEKFVNNSKFKKNITLVHEPKLLNTGGSLLKNRAFFENESLMLIHADNFSVCNYKNFVNAHKNRPKNTIGTMMTFNTDSPESCGIVKLNGQKIVIGFVEKSNKPPSSLANGAVYIFETSIFELLNNERNEIIDFSNDIIPKLLGKIYSFHNSECHIDIGTMTNYQRACQYVESYPEKFK